ncbi:MAG: hypothetical protein ACI9MR_004673, partial [Myxococcota bacterium]
PLVAGLEAEGLPYRLVEVVEGIIDPCEPPPAGIWLNRMSPSSHTRGHETSVALMGETLAWLEAYDRRVINGRNAFDLEMSKLRQDLALRRHGIQTPRTVLTVGYDALIVAARTFSGPFMTKHNQGGKGLGIRRFDHVDELQMHLKEPSYDPGPRAQMLVQQYIEPREPFITRVEIVGESFLYAMRSSTVGGFELCPSDACEVPAPSAAPEVCPADGSGDTFQPAAISADDPLIQQYLAMCKAEELEIAGIEFVEGHDGQRYTYDINGTTNYNSGVGRKVGVDGMRQVARYIKKVVDG